MQTYLFTYAERISNIRGSSLSKELLYNVEHYELVYQPKLDLVMECNVPFGGKLQVSPYPIPNHADHRLNRLLKCYRYSKSEGYK